MVLRREFASKKGVCFLEGKLPSKKAVALAKFRRHGLPSKKVEWITLRVGSRVGAGGRC